MYTLNIQLGDHQSCHIHVYSAPQWQARKLCLHLRHYSSYSQRSVFIGNWERARERERERERQTDRQTDRHRERQRQRERVNICPIWCCIGPTYNIPIIFWIHPKHPYEAPVVYVLPTTNMDIQPSQYVDANGRVHMPYLNFWKVSYQCSASVGLVPRLESVHVWGYLQAVASLFTQRGIKIEACSFQYKYTPQNCVINYCRGEITRGTITG